jgi:hypothetical protein
MTTCAQAQRQHRKGGAMHGEPLIDKKVIAAIAIAIIMSMYIQTVDACIINYLKKGG